MKINPRIEAMTLSPVRKVLDRARQLEQGGRRIVHFEIGEPDFDTPEIIKEASKKALDDNLTHYGPNRGLIELRTVISRIMEKENNLTYDPVEEIIVTVGAAEALVATLGSYITEGDEVIIFTPAFMNYRNIISMFGGNVRGHPSRRVRRFSAESPAGTIRDHTKDVDNRLSTIPTIPRGRYSRAKAWRVLPP